MVQPKKPPISIRLPDAVLAKVDAWASRRGCARNAAIVQMLEAAEDEVIRTARAAKERLRAKPLPIQPDQRAAGSPLHVSVPFAGTLDRKPMPKGSKK